MCRGAGGPRAHRECTRKSGDERLAEDDTAVPGIECFGLTAHDFHRSAASAAARDPRCSTTRAYGAAR
jgi:hypothetical protein